MVDELIIPLSGKKRVRKGRFHTLPPLQKTYPLSLEGATNYMPKRVFEIQNILNVLQYQQNKNHSN